MRGILIVLLAFLWLVSSTSCGSFQVGIGPMVYPRPTNTLPPGLAATFTPFPYGTTAPQTSTQTLPTGISPTTQAAQPLPATLPPTGQATPAAGRPAPATQAQLASLSNPINPLPTAAPGPETLDLSNPVLYRNPLSDYTARLDDQIEGSARYGGPSVFTARYMVRIQTQPAPAWAASNSILDDSTRVDWVSFEGTLFTATADGKCITGVPGGPPGSPVAALGQVLTGAARRVAEGVAINGLITDQYAVTAQNLVQGGQYELAQPSRDGTASGTSTLVVKLHGAGNLFLARQGGFVLRLELSDQTTAQEEDFFYFQPGSPMSSHTVIELIPTQPEDEPISYPAGCGGELGANEPQLPVTSGNGSATPVTGSTADTTRLPLPHDAQIVTEHEDGLVYTSPSPTDQLEAFYKTEMTARGYTLDSSSKVGPIANLIFSMDGQQVTITMLPTGETVTVTVSITAR